MKNKNRLYKLDIQQITLIVLFVLMGIIATTAITLAVFSGIASDRQSILFAPAVEVQITSRDENSKPLELGLESILPNQTVPIDLGFKLSGRNNEVSSPAYVRAKFESEVKIKPGDDDLNALENLIEFTNSIYTDSGKNLTWVLVNFAPDGEPDDLWYVYVEKIDTINHLKSKVVENGETGTFMKGNVVFSQEIDRRFANREFVINYTIEASQSANTQDPIISKEPIGMYNDQPVYRGIWQNPA